jgi:hypothetical protein
VADEPFLALPSSVEGTPLEAILVADSALERARARRVKLAHLLALLGVPLWLVAAWPARWAADLRALVLAGFAVALAGVVGSLVSEWRWGRLRSRRIAALGPLPRTRAEACAGRPDEQS